MTRWTYTILNITFFAPVILYVLFRHWKAIKSDWRFIVFSGFAGFILFFAVDPVATYWGSWGFDYSKTLGIRFGFSVLEELVWAILVSMIVGTAIAAEVNKQKQR